MLEYPVPSSPPGSGKIPWSGQQESKLADLLTKLESAIKRVDNATVKLVGASIPAPAPKQPPEIAGDKTHLARMNELIGRLDFDVATLFNVAENIESFI
jgi:hypothetical protein